MNSDQLNHLLEQLISKWENEVIEFKQVGKDFDTDRLAKYFSALSNEANLRGLENAWLVFGVNDKDRQIVGTEYRSQSDRLQSLKHQIACITAPNTTFRNIYELQHEAGRVLLFEIPSAPRGIPIASNGHFYARNGESLMSLSLDKLDKIRQQTLAQDWTAQIVVGATENDLDEAAVVKARESFAIKHANRITPDEVMQWPLSTFLERAKLTRDGKITRATLLLLGKSESSWHLSPHPAQLTWKLTGAEHAYEHFSLPFLLNTTNLYQRIRNIQLRILPHNQLLPIEVAKYNQKIVLEALHNCIAHQDYTLGGRVLVTEHIDRLVFQNVGDFFDGRPDEYVEGHKTPCRYRNPFLAQAMSELNMIDTMGYGIHQIYEGQARRYFPLPDYDLSEVNAVKLTIYGEIMDLAYTQLLIEKTDLSLPDVLALDRVQKKLPIPDEVAAQLRKAKLIEGRKPNYSVSAFIASVGSSKAEYVRTRAQDDEFYLKLIMDYLRQFGKADRSEINQLLFDKLSNALNEKQKEVKVGNLLTKLRKAERIVNKSSRKNPIWMLVP